VYINIPRIQCYNAVEYKQNYEAVNKLFAIRNNAYKNIRKKREGVKRKKKKKKKERLPVYIIWALVYQ